MLRHWNRGKLWTLVLVAAAAFGNSGRCASAQDLESLPSEFTAYDQAGGGVSGGAPAAPAERPGQNAQSPSLTLDGVHAELQRLQTLMSDMSRKLDQHQGLHQQQRGCSRCEPTGNAPANYQPTYTQSGASQSVATSNDLRDNQNVKVTGEKLICEGGVYLLQVWGIKRTGTEVVLAELDGACPLNRCPRVQLLSRREGCDGVASSSDIEEFKITVRLSCPLGTSCIQLMLAKCPQGRPVQLYNRCTGRP